MVPRLCSKSALYIMMYITKPNVAVVIYWQYSCCFIFLGEFKKLSKRKINRLQLLYFQGFCFLNVHKFPFGATLRLINSFAFLFGDNKKCACVYICVCIYVSYSYRYKFVSNPTWRRLHCHFICLQNGSIRLKCTWRNIREEIIALSYKIKLSSLNCEAKGSKALVLAH